MSNLDLGIIGNCGYSALVNKQGHIVWCCLPRFDSDPVFHSLLGSPASAPDDGLFAVDLEGMKHASQSYDPNTAILRTRLEGETGAVEIVDFAPRFKSRDRVFRPTMIVRRLLPVSGSPRIRVRLRPRFSYGGEKATVTRGSNHMRYVGSDMILRLTTDAPLDYIAEESFFLLDEPTTLVLGPDETLSDGPSQTGLLFEEKTRNYWRDWARRLALPYEWQDAVIRAAITLKLCTYEPTGAIIAAMTTSIPEAANSERNWDYRYCWLRDAFFVVRALNSLAAVNTMENYVRWLVNIVSTADGHLQPVYSISGGATLRESLVDSLPGYRGMGPVRRGNQAYEHFQHDVYGNVVLGASQAFFDQRLMRPSGLQDFHRLEVAGEQAYRLHNEPDAGMWELRTRARVHTSSSLMCWAACDRLAKIAQYLGLKDRADFWGKRAATIKKVILENAWNEKRGAFVESFGGEYLDAGVLLMSEVGFLDNNDPRFISTVEQLEKHLADGPHMRRYEAPDDFGAPEVAFVVCSAWRVDALAKIGRKEQAREIFEALLETRNHLGLLSEDVVPSTGELWGNYPQTYSMVGIVNGAVRLSKPWESVI